MTWTCDDARARLDDRLEGSLPEAERQALTAHLEACPACRAELAGLEALRDATAGLPREIRPPRDLWPAIDARLGEAGPEAARETPVVPLPRAAARGLRAGFRVPRRGLVAAALALVVATAAVTATVTRRWDEAMALKLRRAQEAPAAAGPADADPEATFLAASQELLDGLEGRPLSPETRAIVRRNLAVIDAAIAELRVALERDPGNGELNRMLLATYQRKIELLEQAARAGEEG